MNSLRFVDSLLICLLEFTLDLSKTKQNEFAVDITLHKVNNSNLFPYFDSSESRNKINSSREWKQLDHENKLIKYIMHATTGLNENIWFAIATQSIILHEPTKGYISSWQLVSCQLARKSTTIISMPRSMLNFISTILTPFFT